MSSPTSTITDDDRTGTPQFSPYAGTNPQQQHQPVGHQPSAHEQQFAAVNGGSQALSQQQQRNDRVASNGNAPKVPVKQLPVPISRHRSHDTSSAPSPVTPTEPATSSMTPVRNGPIAKDRPLPPRAKPGRKPIAENSKGDRRRQQNRDAQRKFRDRRAEKVKALQQEISEQKQQHQATEHDVRRENETLKQENATLKSEVQQLRGTVHDLQQRMNRLDEDVRQMRSQQPSQGPPFVASTGQFRAMGTTQQPISSSSYNNIRTPESENSYFETDFTHLAKPEKANFNLRPAVSHDSNDMDFTMDRGGDDHCGFCTDDQNCACKQERGKPVPVEPPVNVKSLTLPGSCDMCRADPVRAQACKDMARSAQIASQSSEVQRLTPVLMPPPPRRSCASMVDAFHQFGQHTSSIASLFGGKLNTFPAEKGGYEFEETQAAEVLSTLSRRSTMAETPQPDESSPRNE